MPGDTAAVYVESSYILYIREDNLLAAKFDASGPKIVGPAVPVAEKVGSESDRYVGAFTASQNGMLLYSTDTTIVSSTLDLWCRMRPTQNKKASA